jgi:hypothetical protein
MGAAARSKRSTAFAERLTVTRVDPEFEPEEDMPPAATGAVRVVVEVEEAPAAYGLVRPPLPPYSSVGGGSGVCVATGYSRVTGEERGHLVHILLSVALEGGKAGDAHARARGRAGARRHGAAARGRGEAGRQGGRGTRRGVHRFSSRGKRKEIFNVPL